MRSFHVKITLAGKYSFIKSVMAADALVAVQDITHDLRAIEVVCDIRAEVVDEPSPVVVETLDQTDRPFAFRARLGDKVTRLCSYTDFAYIDGYVVATEYFGSSFFHLVPVPVALFALQAGTCAEQDIAEIFKTNSDSDDSDSQLYH